MLEEAKNELNFLRSLCESIKGLDKETQLFIAKAYLKEEEPKKEEDAFDKAVREIEEVVSYQDFYATITDNLHIESHDYAKKLYSLLNAHFKLRRYI